MIGNDRRPHAADIEVQVRYRLIEALQEREQLLAEAQRAAHLGSWSKDLRTGEVHSSDEWYRLFGRVRGVGDVGWEAVRTLTRADHRGRCDAIVRTAVSTATPCTFECPVVIDGEERWLHFVVEIDTDAAGKPVRLHGITQDVSDRHRAEESVEAMRGLFQAIVENTSDIVTILDERGVIRYSSPSNVLGRSIGSLDGTPIIDLLHPDDVELATAAVARLRSDPSGSTIRIELRLQHADGSWRTFASTGKNLLEDPSIRGYLFITHDITEERRLQFELRHDSLTGLPNRLALEDVANGVFARAARRRWTTALMIIDVDGFRRINSAHGHHVGDQVLVEVARRLEAGFRLSDGVARAAVNVGRVAGDEFLVLCEQVDTVGSITALWDRVQVVLADPIRVDALSVPVSVSIGISVVSSPPHDFSVMVEEAETALRVVKKRGGGDFELFDDALRQAESAREEAKRRLEGALREDRFRLHYQPKVSISTGVITGAEGLLRWEDPERGLIPPFEFIPLAEQSGLIVPIGAWVIEEACRQIAIWESSFPDRPPLIISVNVSARQFGPALTDTVRRALRSAGISAQRLCLEVTESILMEDVAGAVETLRALTEVGVSLSIDDFGTGYSSLAYLKQFELDELKIDKSFVDGLGHDKDDTSIVAAIIALAHALELSVVAEGVETQEQADRLRSLGCEVAQGYFFARPAPAETMSALLAKEAADSWEQRGERPGGQANAYRAERVLIVDDSSEVRLLARLSLASVGFEVSEATDGLEGVQLAKELRPDCILLDVMMPGLNGIDACRALRADPATAGATIVMLTANAEAADKVEAYSYGADDYIIKPFAPRDLSHRVHAAMRHRAEARQVPD
ncbi:MAG TPA: EAL domain-containing protein [Acidimicrobiales bacterium]|nr:EAL domain-containing protein [Acidimicrobiales bacterium]